MLLSESDENLISENPANLNVVTRAQSKKLNTNSNIIPIIPSKDIQKTNQNSIATPRTQNNNQSSIVDIDPASDLSDVESTQDVPTNDLCPQTQFASDQSTPSLGHSQYNCDQSIVNLSDEAEIIEIIKLHHDSPIGAHFGVDKTLEKIKQYYTWYGMRADIADYIKHCVICQKNKSQGTTRAPMIIVSTSKHSFDRLSIDIVGPLIVCEDLSKYILSVQDDLTKYVMFIPIPNQESGTVAKALVEKVFLIFGASSGILSDLGTNFMSKLMVSLCKFWRIHKSRCTPYHPQSNGGLERSHFFLKNYLRSFINNNQNDWSNWCSFAAFSYNTTPHVATKISPFELMFGRKAILPPCMSKSPVALYNYDNYLADLKYKLQTANSLAIKNLRFAKIRSKEFFDKKAKQTFYSVGDSVLLKASQNKIGRPLFEKWTGPYKVIEVPSSENVIIKI